MLMAVRSYKHSNIKQKFICDATLSRWVNQVMVREMETSMGSRVLSLVLVTGTSGPRAEFGGESTDLAGSWVSWKSSDFGPSKALLERSKCLILIEFSIHHLNSQKCLHVRRIVCICVIFSFSYALPFLRMFPLEHSRVQTQTEIHSGYSCISRINKSKSWRLTYFHWIHILFPSVRVGWSSNSVLLNIWMRVERR